LLGTILASGVVAAFNSVGAHVVTLAVFLTGLFLATPFSFFTTHAALSGPLAKLSPMARLRARWSDWREARHKQGMQRKLQKTKAKGREPVPTQTIAGMESRKAALIEDDEEHEAEEAPE